MVEFLPSCIVFFQRPESQSHPSTTWEARAGRCKLWMPHRNESPHFSPCAPRWDGGHVWEPRSRLPAFLFFVQVLLSWILVETKWLLRRFSGEPRCPQFWFLYSFYNNWFLVWRHTCSQSASPVPFRSIQCYYSSARKYTKWLLRRFSGESRCPQFCFLYSFYNGF